MKNSIHKIIDTLDMSTKPDPALYTLVGKHVLIKDCSMVPRLIRGYSGVATDVYIRDDQVPFYHVKLDVVQANGHMTDYVKRLNEKCNGQNGKYLVQTAHVVEDPTPDPLPKFEIPSMTEEEMSAMFSEFRDVLRQAMDEFPGNSPLDRDTRYLQYMPRMMAIFQSVMKRNGVSLSDDELRVALADLAESDGNTGLSVVIKKLVPATQ